MNENADCHAWDRLPGVSGDDRLDHMTVDVGQTAIEAVVIVGKLFMIESEQMQHGGIEVPHGRRIDFAASPEGIGCPVTGSSLNACPEHPARETIRIVISSGGSRLVRWHPTEFGGPQDERIVEHPALRKVGNQSSGRLIKDRTMSLVIELECFVRIPVEQTIDP